MSFSLHDITRNTTLTENVYITINHLLIDIEIFFTVGMKNEIGEEIFFFGDRKQGAR